MRESAPPESTPPSRWHPLVISVIGLLCTMFLLLSCYRILRTGRRHLDEETREEPSLQFHSRGLDSSIVQCLPIIQYTKKKKKNDGETEPGDMECTVCLGDFEPGDMLRFLPNCAHSFHVACVDTWFKSHSNCPLCRSSVLYNSNDHHSYSVSVLTSVESHRREAAVSEAASSSHDSSLQEDSTVRPPFQQISFT